MRRKIFHNIRLKLFALLLATVSWYAIRETISFETNIRDIPIEIKLDAGWAVLDQSASVVEVTLRGAQDDIRLLDKTQIKALIDMSSDSVVGPASTEITPDDIKGVRSARIIRVKPDSIQLSLDKAAEKLVPVISRTVGRPYYGEVEQVVCEPAIVLIRGPAGQLDRTEWVSTESVDVGNRVQSFTTRKHVLSPSATQPYQIEPPDVLVHVMITGKSESFEWKDIPVLAIVSPGSTIKANITPSHVNVRVAGRPEIMSGMGDIVPRVFVDCADLDPSLSYDLPVNIHLAVGLELSAVAEPAFVRVVMGQ